MLLVSNVPYSAYQNKGVFSDISAIIPTDALYPEIIAAYSSDSGALDSILLSFSIGCLVVPEAIAQGRTGWTLEEFLDSTGGRASIFIYDVYTLAEMLITRILCVSQANKDIQGILSEKLGAFLSGDKSKEETTDIIENRLNIYLSEQS